MTRPGTNKDLPMPVLQYASHFKKQYKIDFDILFDDKLYLVFYAGEMFKTSVRGNQVDKQSIYQFYCIMKFIRDIQEIMK